MMSPVFQSFFGVSDITRFGDGKRISVETDNLVSLKVQDKDVKNLALNLVLGILTSLFLLNYIVTIVRSNSMLGEVVRSQFVEKRRQVKNFEKCE